MSVIARSPVCTPQSSSKYRVNISGRHPLRLIDISVFSDIMYHVHRWPFIYSEVFINNHFLIPLTRASITLGIPGNYSSLLFAHHGGGPRETSDKLRDPPTLWRGTHGQTDEHTVTQAHFSPLFFPSGEGKPLSHLQQVSSTR